MAGLEIRYADGRIGSADKDKPAEELANQSPPTPSTEPVSAPKLVKKPKVKPEPKE